MKICWDNLEKLEYNIKKNKWYERKNNKIIKTYIYKDICKNCGEPYLANAYIKGLYCCAKCQNSGKNNPMYGKKRPDISGDKNYNKRPEVKKRKSLLMKGDLNPSKRPEVRKKLKEKSSGKNNAMYNGGYAKNNIPVYDKYYKKISIIENVRRNKQDSNILEVKCAYCGEWFVPKMSDIWHRMQSFNGTMRGENRLYCSIKCKKECPIFKQIKYPRGFKQITSREVQPELRQLVFKRDNYTCQKCYKHKDKLNVGLHCHHIEGIRWEPIESADINNCITLCKDCHKEVHKKNGCGYNEMKCKQ